MAFWTVFKGRESQESFINSLHNELKKHFQNHDEDRLTVIACVAGLLAHVAFSDLNLEESEIKRIHEIIHDYKDISKEEALVITNLATEHAKEFSGLENHLLTNPLTELLTQNERFELVKALFQVAASDGSVSSLESEEVRLINHSLKLSNQHYLAARATVSKDLAALK